MPTCQRRGAVRVQQTVTGAADVPSTRCMHVLSPGASPPPVSARMTPAAFPTLAVPASALLPAGYRVWLSPLLISRVLLVLRTTLIWPK